ncbi:galactosyltransferase-related protein [Parabacteroides sp.]
MNNIELEITGTDLSWQDIKRILYCYILACTKQDKRYERHAVKLLMEFEEVVVEKTSREANVLIRLGMILLSLYRKERLKGTVEILFRMVDSAIYRFFPDILKQDIGQLAVLIHYLRNRTCMPVQDKDMTNDLNNRQNLILVLDKLNKYQDEGIALPDSIIEELKILQAERICPEQTACLLEIGPDVSIVIPLRIDSPERERNLDTLLLCLCKMKFKEIILLEADEVVRYHVKIKDPSIRYVFVKDDDPVFYRTRYLNQLLYMANSAIIGIWDTDVIVPESQIMDAVSRIRSGKAVMAYPYDGRFCALTEAQSAAFEDKIDISELTEHIDDFQLPAGDYSVGGAFLVNKYMYLNTGGENENFYGWGPEDLERIKRIKILGLPVYRAAGCLFHLHHPRNENSGFATPELEISNRKEFLKICGMTQAELCQYIHSWTWRAEI